MLCPVATAGQQPDDVVPSVAAWSRARTAAWLHAWPCAAWPWWLLGVDNVLGRGQEGPDVTRAVDEAIVAEASTLRGHAQASEGSWTEPTREKIPFWTQTLLPRGFGMQTVLSRGAPRVFTLSDLHGCPRVQLVWTDP